MNSQLGQTMGPDFLPSLPLLDLRAALGEALMINIGRKTECEPAVGNAFMLRGQSWQAREWVRDFFVNLAVPGAIAGVDKPAIWHSAQDMIGEEWAKYQQEVACKLEESEKREQAAEASVSDYVAPGEVIVHMSGVTIRSASVLGIIAAERKRQVEVKGWSTQHDDQHINGELAEAAACYAAKSNILAQGAGYDLGIGRDYRWPFAKESFKPNPGNRKWELIKACALLVAEIERLDRMATKASANGTTGADCVKSSS